MYTEKIQIALKDLVKINEFLILAIDTIRSNKLRSFLTLLGMIIGVAAVVAVLSILDGFSKQIFRSFSRIGTNMIYITSNNNNFDFLGESKGLNIYDSEAIKREIRTIRFVVPSFKKFVKIRYSGTTVKADLIGTISEHQQLHNVFPESGRFLNPLGSDQFRYVCIIGKTIEKDLRLNGGDAVGKILNVDKKFFEIIGVLEKKGQRFGVDLDNVILVPLELAKVLYGKESYMSIQIMAEVESHNQIGNTISQIRNLLRQRHGIIEGQEDDFKVLKQTDLIDNLKKTSRLITFVVSGIVGISLLVGGIGIMNIMLASVSERTNEIGLRKSVGAKDSDILTQFLIEAVILSSMGGVAGIVVGISSSLLFSALTNLPAVVNLSSGLIAFIFALSVGIFFGIYPASKAGNLDPIEALRYE